MAGLLDGIMQWLGERLSRYRSQSHHALGVPARTNPIRAICATLVAQAFQSVRNPILPLIENVPSKDPECPGCMVEFLHVRHHSRFVPRGFDVSPDVAVVKPTRASGFDHRALACHGGAGRTSP